MRPLFPYLPTQSRYNKSIRAAIRTLRAVIAHLLARTSNVSDHVCVVDSTPVKCARSRETAKRSDLAAWAAYRYRASHPLATRSAQLRTPTDKTFALSGLSYRKVARAGPTFTIAGAKGLDETQNPLPRPNVAQQGLEREKQVPVCIE